MFVSDNRIREIIRLAREIDADLIVLSTRGHSGLKHLLLGSTAERVVRNAPCPVLVARKRKQRTKANREAFAVRTILVPTDFSQCALAGVQYAVFWQRNLMPHCVSSTRCIRIQTMCSLIAPASCLSGLAEAVKETARQEMDALKQMDFLQGLPVQIETHPGPAVDEICASAGAPGSPS